VARGVTQADLASQSGLSTYRISRLENKKVDFRPAEVKMLAQLLQIPKDRLLQFPQEVFA